ncbi:MAG: peptide ABC transporter permease [Chloroflexi bacterium RBG_16_57_11]|nr:MAG: peptide ABC transporter permease [Chloroflexi bacterium RBG_16_57_11]
MQRWEYVFRRLILAMVVLFSVSLLTFFIARILPSDPAAAWVGPRPTQEQIAKATITLGLDKPLYVQYWRYLSSLLQGDLGVSIKSRQPILTELKTYLPATLELVIASMLIGEIIGIPLGVLSGAKKGGALDNASRILAVACVSLPTFFLGLLFQLIFYARLGILPISGRVSNEIAINNPVTPITGFYTLDTLMTGNWAAFQDVFVHLILPAVTLAAFGLGLSVRMTRASIIEVLNEKYILAARVAGLPYRTILFVLALKNAIMPTLNVIGLSFVYALTGSILVEVIFSWPGLGLYLTNAVLSLDFPVIVSVTLIVAVFYVVVNLVLDLVQVAIDPRVTLS